jgi:hypothetical protein
VSATTDRSRARLIAGVVLWKWVALLIAVVLLVVALVVGSSSSSPTVAKVNGKAITVDTFNRWLLASAVSAHQSDSSVPAVPPVAPDYTSCITFERAAAAKAKAKTQTSTKTLKGDCREYRVSLAESVMQFLIGGEWFLAQGVREHVNITAKQVATAMKSSFPKTSGLLHFLNSSGLSRTDLEFEARSYLVAQRLDAAHSGKTPTITEAEITSYYNSNKSDMDGETLAKATPTIRELLVSEAQAPTLDAYLTTVQKYWRPKTSCARGYRISYYCGSAT